MITTLLALAPLLCAPADVEVTWSAFAVYADGLPFRVEVTLTAGEEGAVVPSWLFGAAAFEKDGTPLGPRPEGTVALPASAEVSLAFDLGPSLQATAPFTLGFAAEYSAVAPVPIRIYRVADPTVDFKTAPVESLSNYVVLMETNRGPMVFEVWPDVAPNHARNFLDLNHRGFYENLVFHRVSPVFMIQGGDPSQRIANAPRWTGGSTVPPVNAEFNERKHVRGVLSAARLGHDVNSATSQFFVMMTPYPSLDGQYTAYGKLIAGDDTLDRIAHANGVASPRDGTVTPSDPQQILRTFVLQSN